VIPNPRSSRVLEPDDKLLCFGKMEYMRDMVPKKARRRRQPEVKELVTEESGTHQLQERG